MGGNVANIMIPKFLGTLDVDWLYEWLETIVKVFSNNQCEEGQKVKMVVARLRGSALTWWQDFRRKRKRRKC